MFQGASSFNQCLPKSKFPGKATGTLMFALTANAISVADPSCSTCPAGTCEPTTSPSTAPTATPTTADQLCEFNFATKCNPDKQFWDCYGENKCVDLTKCEDGSSYLEKASTNFSNGNCTQCLKDGTDVDRKTTS